MALLLVFLTIISSFPWHRTWSFQLALGTDSTHQGRQNSVFARFKAEMKSTLASPTRKKRKENKSHKSSGGQDTGLETLDPFSKRCMLACLPNGSFLSFQTVAWSSLISVESEK